jgi:hypothetical protein
MAPDARTRPGFHCANVDGQYCSFTEHPGKPTRQEHQRYSPDLCIRLYLVLPRQTAGHYSARFGPAIVGGRSLVRCSSSSTMGTRHCIHVRSVGISDVGLLLGKFLLANRDLGRGIRFRFGGRAGASPCQGAESHSTACIRGPATAHCSGFEQPGV